jgi:hypothetical protein
MPSPLTLGSDTRLDNESVRMRETVAFSGVDETTDATRTETAEVPA